jgi:hypothetical protein
VNDAQLMQKIRNEMGDYIAGAVEGTPFPPALVAALVANESSGQANLQRFEPAVFAELARVITLQKTNYAPAGCKKPLAQTDLMPHVWPQTLVGSTGKSSEVFTFPQGVQALQNLATSYGPTQIMGWHSIEFGYPLGDLPNLQRHFDRAVELLAWFGERYEMMESSLSETEFATAIFHCWNTGSPVAPTYDPDYVAHGLARMALYGETTAETAAD